MDDLAALARGGGPHKNWALSIDLSGLKEAVDQYGRRSDGFGTAAGVVLISSFTSTALLRELPYVPAGLLGAAGGAYAVQLPRGNRIGDATRQVGRQVASLGEMLTTSSTGRKAKGHKRRR
eukprot:TRINITY_DN64261_c0_g1_i1.p1 TRINITY_DN64261_c0_g1~~TRINITY_DN64261_c0_g1_i1.p1  ORF type:complete len:121 (-),score=20.04 TRINITY_DN64261_c0_g1_i1:196-558(-)